MIKLHRDVLKALARIGLAVISHRMSKSGHLRVTFTTPTGRTTTISVASTPSSPDISIRNAVQDARRFMGPGPRRAPPPRPTYNKGPLP